MPDHPPAATTGQTRPNTLTLQILVGNVPIESFELAGPTELGRREPTEQAPYFRLPQPGGLERLVIADWHEKNVSRKHLLIEPLPDGKVRLKNLSDKNGLALGVGKRIEPGETRLLELPIYCELGSKLLRLERPADEPLLQSLGQRSLAPQRSLLGAGISLASLRPLSDIASASPAGGLKDSDLMAWLQNLVQVFQSAAGSADFLPQAAQAAAQLVDLDTVAVLLREGTQWNTAAVCGRMGRSPASQWRPSQTMLAQVLERQEPFFISPAPLSNSASLIGVKAVVAAPILDPDRKVLGALYGEGRSGGRGAARPMTALEVKLFDLLAYGVAAGLARLEQERKLIAERVRFEQFFTPELARVLAERGDELLTPREAEVTVVFCDIRGFSEITSRLPAEVAIEWVRETLSLLSDCVAEFEGTLIDFGGDSLEALWGAPLADNDHAVLACSAALAMQENLPALSARWLPQLGTATEVRIGIHTGLAQVGNIGASRKFKYGAFGTTVNLASRVQGATKHLGVPLLITSATALKVASHLAIRRLAQVRTVNISQPIELYELAAESTASFVRLRDAYETALSLFETRQFAAARQGLEFLAAEFPTDEPTRTLLARVVEGQKSPEQFDAVWTLKGK